MPAFYQVQEPGLLFAFHRVPDLQGFTLAASSYFCLKHFALLGILRWRISNLVLLPFSSYIFPSYIFIICTIYHLSASYLSSIQVSFSHPSINNDFRSVYNHGFLFYSVSYCLFWWWGIPSGWLSGPVSFVLISKELLILFVWKDGKTSVLVAFFSGSSHCLFKHMKLASTPPP